MIKINSLYEFNELNSKNSEKIISIIINKQNFNNLEILCNSNLINLERLELEENNIDDLSPLIKVKFINLKYLKLQKIKFQIKTLYI